MKKQINPTIKAYLLRGALYAPMLLAICAIPFALAQQGSKKTVANNVASGDVPVVQSADGVVRGTQAVSPALTAPEAACSNYNTTTGTGTITAGGTDIGNHCDDCTTDITLPFPVSVYGNPPVTAVAVGSDGDIHFPGPYNKLFPWPGCVPVDPGTGQDPFLNTLFPYYTDLVTDETVGPCPGCGIFTQTLGTAPNRQFIIRWKANYFSSPPGPAQAEFEVLLTEGSNTLSVIYGTTGDNGLTAVSGIQQDLNVFTSFSCDEAVLTNGLKVTYTCGTVVPTDFNHDRFPDFVLFNSGTRRTAIWFLNNNSFIGSAFGPTLPAGWNVIDTGDFDGDGDVDYVLFNATTRQTAIWYLTGTTFMSAAFGPMLPAGWALVASDDFNGDHPDYVLYNASSRRTAIWYLNNNVFVSGAFGPTLPSGWRVVGAADFNGDGKPDYLLFNAGTRQTAIWYLNNNVFVSGAFGPRVAAGYTLTGTADFNRDGKSDYALFNASTRRTAIWYLNNNVFVSGAFGPTLPSGWSLVRP